MTDEPSRPASTDVLGATVGAEGTTFAVYSSAAAYGGSVTLCLLDDAGGERRLQMWPEADVWACFVPGVGPGQRYGYRATGPFEPWRGLRFDGSKLLLDPYARALTPVDPARPRLLHGVVVGGAFDWGDDRPPDRPWSDTILYETHVRGISATHPDVPERERGTYAALASPPIREHLVDLGVTAVELMPVHQFLDEQFLQDRGLTNYWGYSTIGFFAPHGRYSASGAGGGQVVEFKELVKALHRAGLEVILDVVYNHTAEGPADLPALSFRGLANEVYYRHDPADPGRYRDTTGTGNSLDPGRPEVLRLIMDSLRYWVMEMHVDGFRFDLAATLARDYGYVDRLAAFFDLVYQDPVVGRVKLIAEPWDVNAPDSYQVGRFPPRWVEWNDKFRDGVRDFWRGRTGIAELGYRVTGSSDLYGAARRGPDASLNFVTAHDGKTLTDVVTYVGKYNQANGEGNRDGHNDDRAENHGVEGPTGDPDVNAARRRHRRNLLATMLLSQGVTMIGPGDELGRTQRGNNNAYCQDNETSWYDWTAGDGARDLTSFVRRAVALHRAQPALRRRSFLTGAGEPLPDVTWFGLDGAPLDVGRWLDPGARFLGYLLAGDRTDLLDDAGAAIRGDDVVVALNAGMQPVELPLPGRQGALYTIVLDTMAEDGAGSGAPVFAGGTVTVGPRALIVAVAPLPHDS
jgi:glycogen operon protein